MNQLTFFTHAVEGKLYGGWYRVCSPTEVEVQAIGLLQVASWEGRSPEAAAQCCLEEFITERQRNGEPTPVLDEMAGELEQSDVFRYHLTRRSATLCTNHRVS